MNKFIKAVGLALTLFAAPEAWTYTLTQDFQQGIYIPNFPIDMKRFAVDASEGSTLQSITQAATDEWENALGVDLWDVQGNYTLALGGYSGNYIRWSNNFAAETGFDPTRTLAVTVRYNNGNFVTNIIIILNGGMPFLRANQNNILYKTILHELGHTIGLDHSQQPAIMQAFVGQIDHLTQDDVDGGNAIVDETLNRQSSGFVAKSTADVKDGATKMVGCGSIQLVESGGGGSGIMAPLLSFLIGLLAISLGRKLSHGKARVS